MFTLSVAFKFFTSKKTQTLLILFGFGVGIAVNLFVGSLIQSLQDDLIQNTVGNQPHVSILPGENKTYVENWNNIKPLLDNRDDLEIYSASLDGRAFITNISPNSPSDIIMRGADLDQANGIYNLFNSKTYYGEKPGTGEVTIGLDLALELGVNVSDELVIKSDPRPFASNHTMKIAGIFDLGVTNLNLLWVFSPLSGAETVLNVTGEYTGIYMQVKDIFAADTIATELKATINNENVVVTNWKDTNESLLKGLQAQSSSTSIIQVFVLLSVVIGITSILSVTVLQKSRQIGILKAMGLSDRRSAEVFILQGLLYGIFGSFIGTGIGIGLIWSFNTFAGGAEAGLFDIYIQYNLVIITNVVAIIFSIVAAMIPARTSSKMEVIDIIRNN